MSMADNISVHAAEALRYILGQLPSELAKPKIGIVCGSGLGGLVETVLPHPRHQVPYTAIPHFPPSTGKLHCPPQPLVELTIRSAWPCWEATFWTFAKA